MSRRDPFEIFGLLDPFDDEAFGDVDVAVLARITSSPQHPVSAPRRRARPWLIGGGIAVVMLATAAFALLRHDRASNPTGVVCYRTADINGDRAALEPSLDPVAACARPWRDGTFSTDGPPAMVGCVNAAGIAAVFPGTSSDAVCSRLGLPGLVLGRSKDEEAIVTLQQRLADTFSASCYDQTASLAKAQELLDGSGLTGWTVQLAEAFPPGLDCGGPGVLVDTKTVIVGGVRPNTTSTT